VGSCAATGCHGGNAAEQLRGSEYTIWITRDPHARAYQVLFGERSQRIEENLTGRRQSAEKDARCLACHAADPGQVPAADRSLLADGVGCESCHGPAEKWRSQHYLAEWRQLTAAQREALGFHDTTNLTVRARLCVDCHVGAPDREVNHDLIAAGHPRLRFEFGAYLANYPRHWSTEKDKEGRRDFEARAWAVGQVVSAQAALELLASRAGDEKKPWPEFAEYGCFSCHHTLQDRLWRRPPAPGGPKPGSLPWGTWYFAMLPTLAERQATAFDQQPLTALGELMRRPLPDRKRVAAEAHQAARALTVAAGEAGKAPANAQALTGLLAALARERQPALANWDDATQLYLAIAAAYYALGDVDPGQRGRTELRAAIQDLHDDLDRAFPRGRESVYDSPRDYDPRVLSQKLQALRNLLPPPGPK
jgi:hypothetical protein